ncbi:hypothetical protein AGLY_000992 [Aphis glycines]|uniref:Uncharacterized protein n=1 Tax=Aphis glycines TaxID=307491 RepID=A0A6G0UA20_APHGL|nr:hypothetical protein AGLY_000992 [Aphis glycines]
MLELPPKDLHFCFPFSLTIIIWPSLFPGLYSISGPEPITISVFGRIATAHILCAGCSMTCCSELCQTFRYLSSPPVTTNELVISDDHKMFLNIHQLLHSNQQMNFLDHHVVVLKTKQLLRAFISHEEVINVFVSIKTGSGDSGRNPHISLSLPPQPIAITTSCYKQSPSQMSGSLVSRCGYNVTVRSGGQSADIQYVSIENGTKFVRHKADKNSENQRY